MKMSSELHASAAVPREKDLSTHCIGPRPNLDVVEKRKICVNFSMSLTTITSYCIF
jgi:hypothetical protein